MTTYELTVILPTNKEKQALDRVKKVLDSAGSKVQKTEEWGKRTLAYPIRKQTEAVYYALTVDMEPEKTNAVNRVLENDDDVLRHLIIVAPKNAPVAKEEKKESKAEESASASKGSGETKVAKKSEKAVKSEKKPAKAKGKSKK